MSSGDTSGVVRRSSGSSTMRSLLAGIVDEERFEQLLLWPPDVFALVDLVLDASESYRFVVSPPPDVEVNGVAGVASTAAKQWWEWLDGQSGELPKSIVDL